MCNEKTERTTKSRIAANYRGIQQRIEAACRRSGRSESDCKLVAVTKYARGEWVRELVTLEVLDLGESRPQQLVERASLFSEESVRWHLIGHLQRNKARKILPLVTKIHSVDTFRLLDTIDRLAAELDLKPHLLLEVNISGESAKHGFSSHDLLENWRTVLELRHIHVDGLMTMAPLTEDLEETRPIFRELRDLRDRLVEMSPPTMPLAELSMGMSRDFEIAVEEGATLLRIGSGLFEGLESDD